MGEESGFRGSGLRVNLRLNMVLGCREPIQRLKSRKRQFRNTHKDPLKKARDDNARVRAELRQQDDRGHYSDCDPLHSEVKKLQEARKLLRRPA